jgi:hypothetical protein
MKGKDEGRRMKDEAGRTKAAFQLLFIFPLS